MAKTKKSIILNISMVIIILLMIIPQTRTPIQIILQKGIGSIVKPSLLSSSEMKTIANFDWELKQLNEKLFNLKTAEGKVIIINFWATWCPPCIAEMPDFENLYQKYKSNEDVVFLFVSNEDTKIIADFMQEKQFSLPAYQQQAVAPAEFDVSSIPRTFIIDKVGQIVLDKSGVADWDSEKMHEIINALLE